MRSKAFFLRPSTVSIASPFPIPSCSFAMTSQLNHMARTNQQASPSRLLSINANSCSSPTTTRHSSSLGRPPLWIDTDVGFDDLVAIGCCYGAASYEKHADNKSGNGNEKPNQAQVLPTVLGISTVKGGLTSDPSDGVAILKGLLPGTFEGHDSIPIIAGREDIPSQKIDDPSWLTGCREQMIEFCSFEGILLDSSMVQENQRSESDCIETTDGNTNYMYSKMIDANDNHRSNPNDTFHEKFDLVCLGPLTNLAHWLEEIPDFASNRLNSIWILGGNIPICRSSSPLESMGDGKKHSFDQDGVNAEFNFSRDPEAVRTVVHHAALQNTTIHIVPQEVCDRKAFEGSFCQQENPCAAKIIEDWLQSQPPSSELQEEPAQQSPRDTSDTKFASKVTVESILPAWMVRLIRKRTFSVYGDPICIYARQFSDCNGAKSKGISRSQPKIMWKDYYCTSNTNCNTNDEFLSVDEDGRLILNVRNGRKETERNSPEIIEPLPPTLTAKKGIAEQHEGKTQFGVNVRIAHEVELGPNYLDWLAMSLLYSSGRSTTI